jgi:hypothetical protein
MTALPTRLATTRPVELTEIVLKSLLFQAAVRVTSRVVPSAKWAVAVSCWPVPTLTDGLAGVMVIDWRLTGVGLGVGGGVGVRVGAVVAVGVSVGGGNGVAVGTSSVGVGEMVAVGGGGGVGVRVGA